MRGHRLFEGAVVILTGVVLALWLSRGFFLHQPWEMVYTHEYDAYAARLLEFRGSLAAGNLSPEWCFNVRGGLGSPLFTYYQPGFFYLASLPWWLPPVRALGVAVFVLALAGYLGLFGVVARRFGTWPAWVAAVAFVLARYQAIDLYRRGDLSEFGATMLLPWALWGLCDWFERGGWGRLAWLAGASGALVVFHPAAGLIGFALLGLGVVVYGAWTRDRRRIVAAAAGLALGVGLAAFYWYPVFFGWSLVQGERAFVGYFRPEQHFLPLGALVGRHEVPTLGPVSLGLPLLIAAVNVVLLLLRRRSLTAEQARLATVAVVGFVLSVFLMTSASGLIWKHAPVLYKIQFPWRIMTVVTLLTSILVGAVLPWGSRRHVAAAAVAVALAIGVGSVGFTRHRLWTAMRQPQDVEELRSRNFVSDRAGEWMVYGATDSREMEMPRAPQMIPPGEVGALRREPDGLACRVRTAEGAALILPHYYFPVGFVATLDGTQLDLLKGPQGLMGVRLPPNTDGLLEVRFTRTPMRRRGLMVSGVSALALAVVCGTIAMRRRKHAG